jgi:hypothetical protein
MIKVTLNVLVFAVLISTNDVHAWSLFGPRNYEDCILKEMQGITSDRAASAVMRACREKFSDRTQDSGAFVKDCTMTYAGGKFIRGRPESPSKYAEIVFENTTSTIYIPKSMLSNFTNRGGVKFMEENEASIRKICPDIKILP